MEQISLKLGSAQCVPLWSPDKIRARHFIFFGRASRTFPPPSRKPSSKTLSCQGTFLPSQCRCANTKSPEACNYSPHRGRNSSIYCCPGGRSNGQCSCSCRSRIHSARKLLWTSPLPRPMIQRQTVSASRTFSPLLLPPPSVLASPSPGLPSLSPYRSLGTNACSDTSPKCSLFLFT